MSEAFVWFHNSSKKPSDSIEFYESLLGWKRAEGPPGLTMFAAVGSPMRRTPSQNTPVAFTTTRAATETSRPDSSSRNTRPLTRPAAPRNRDLPWSLSGISRMAPAGAPL